MPSELVGNIWTGTVDEQGDPVLVGNIRGPAGPSGSSGGFKFTQPTPASTWTITHNLNAAPSPTIFLDSDPEHPVYTDADYPDLNTIVLTFPSPVSGRAFL